MYNLLFTFFRVLGMVLTEGNFSFRVCEKLRRQEMTLKEVAENVIDNEELKTVVMYFILYGVLNIGNKKLVPYENLVQIQVLECEYPMEEAGYQVGEPWSGNIKSAPILFVNKTLGYVANEYCPRYIPNDCPNGFEIVFTDRIFKNDRLMSGNMTVDQVITFCNTRFKEAALQGNGLYIKTTNGIKPARYWGAVRNNAEYLLPSDLKEFLKQKSESDSSTGEYTREIMKYVACTSVVPFKLGPLKYAMYKRWFEEGNTFTHCWNTFAEEIITLSGARVIVLVGDDVLKAFEDSERFAEKKLLMKEESQPDSKGKSDAIRLYELGNRLIVNVSANQGGIRRFDKYFPEGSEILEALKARMKRAVRVPRDKKTPV